MSQCRHDNCGWRIALTCFPKSPMDLSNWWLLHPHTTPGVFNPAKGKADIGIETASCHALDKVWTIL